VSTAIKAVVLGATGYVGGELLRLIAAHPHFELAAAVSASRSGQAIAETFPHLAGAYHDMVFSAHADWLDGIDAGTDLALFSAAPHGASANLVAQALASASTKNLNVHVVDSSADFRYADRAEYEAIYGAHGAPELLSDFYSSVPEHAAELFVSGTTGSTGSGRSPQAGTHHPERHGNLYAYKPLAHRHAPEIAGLTTASSGRNTTVHFVPHSGPFARGIYATVQAKAAADVSPEQLRNVFEAAYADSPFVQIVDSTPRLKDVVASNFCQIGIATDNDTIVVMTAIDNLVKGAAGGAVQWMNRLWGLPETAGLLAAAPGWV